MKKELWIVIAIVAAFMGVLIGYSVPPMLEVGLIGGDKENIGINTKVDQKLLDHYQSLSEDE